MRQTHGQRKVLCSYQCDLFLFLLSALTATANFKDVSQQWIDTVQHFFPLFGRQKSTNSIILRVREGYQI